MHKDDTFKLNKNSTGQLRRRSKSLEPQQSGKKQYLRMQNLNFFFLGHECMDVIKLPYKELLKGINFSLSGYVNPERTELRELAVAMGAKYFPKFDPKINTHLV